MFWQIALGLHHGTSYPEGVTYFQRNSVELTQDQSTERHCTSRWYTRPHLQLPWEIWAWRVWYVPYYPVPYKWMYNVDPVLSFKKLIVPIRHHQQSQRLLPRAVFYFLLPDEIPTTTKCIKSWSKGKIPFGGCSMVHCMYIILIGQHILPPVKKERIPFRSIFLEREMNPVTIVFTSKCDGY